MEQDTKRPKSTRVDYVLASICIMSLVLNFVLLSNRRDVFQTIRLAFKRVPSVTKEDHVRGPSGGPVVAIMYSDFRCPFCKVLYGNLKTLSNSQKFVWVLRNRPLASHPLATEAAVAAECAAQQGQYWEYADLLFENQEQIRSESLFEVLAQRLNLNQAEFSRCETSSVVDLVRRQSEKAATTLEIDETPTLFINGKRYVGTLPISDLSQLIARSDSLLSRLKSSLVSQTDRNW